jgi:hypothetical protein
MIEKMPIKPATPAAASGSAPASRRIGTKCTMMPIAVNVNRPLATSSC